MQLTAAGIDVFETLVAALEHRNDALEVIVALDDVPDFLRDRARDRARDRLFLEVRGTATAGHGCASITSRK